jgi:hypothetical protein
MHTPKYAPVAEVAKLLGLSVSHLNKLRIYQPQRSPPFVRFGRSVRYPISGPSGVLAWAQTRGDGA